MAWGFPPWDISSTGYDRKLAPSLSMSSDEELRVLGGESFAHGTDTLTRSVSAPGSTPRDPFPESFLCSIPRLCIFTSITGAAP